MNFGQKQSIFEQNILKVWIKNELYYVVDGRFISLYPCPYDIGHQQLMGKNFAQWKICFTILNAYHNNCSLVSPEALLVSLASFLEHQFLYVGCIIPSLKILLDDA